MCRAVNNCLSAEGLITEVLDGDELRLSISQDLGFTKGDRVEHARRVALMARGLERNGVVALVALISPYRSIRNEARSTCLRFLEVYVNAPVHLCEERDVKGLYQRARSGELVHFSGIDDPYEAPENPDVECKTDLCSIDECTEQVVTAIWARLARETV